MKSDQKIIDALNAAVKDERTAIHAYILKSKILDNWGYKDLAKKYMGRAREEMVHLDALLERILFLDGTMPAMTVAIDEAADFRWEIADMLGHDLDLETAAIGSYNEMAALAVQLGDNGTRELAVKHLQDEEGHLNWLQEQLRVLDDTGKQNYLSEAV